MVKLALLVPAMMVGCNVFHYSDIPTGSGEGLPDGDTVGAESGDEPAGDSASPNDVVPPNLVDAKSDSGCIELVHDCEGNLEGINESAKLCLPPTLAGSEIPNLTCLQVGPEQSTNRSRPNPDAFFAVNAAKGERWHFHVTNIATSNIDISLAVLGDCSELQCQTGIDRCPAGGDEHMTFVPDSDGTFYVSVNGLTGDYSQVDVEAYKLKSPPCVGTVTPNGMLAHGESCRPVGDAGVVSGTCDDKCRAILLPDAQMDFEPNNDPYSANVIRMPAGDYGTSHVNGTMEASCTKALDMMAVKVPRGATLTATLTAAVMCPAITLVDKSYTALATTDASSTSCGTITFVSRNDGEYYLQIAPTSQIVKFTNNVQYSLSVQVSPAIVPDQ